MDPKKCLYFATFLFLYFLKKFSSSSLQILVWFQYKFFLSIATSLMRMSSPPSSPSPWAPWCSSRGGSRHLVATTRRGKRSRHPGKRFCVKNQESGLGQLGPNVRFWGWTGAQLSTFTWQKVGPNWDGTMYSSDQHDWNLQILDGLVDVADPTVLPLHPQVHRQCDRRLFITHLDNFFKRYLWFHLKLNSLIQKKNCHSP